MSIHIVLVEPEIPPNTGNIIRTSACIGATLHLIEPLGFSLDEKHLRRSGLDYHDLAHVKTYASFEAFAEQNPGAYYLFTTKTDRLYTEVSFEGDCYLIFGKETKGLSEEIKHRYSDRLVRLPMIKDARARSLNLSNAVAIAAFEAVRQLKPDNLY